MTPPGDGELVHESFRAFVARRLGADGRAWLDGLPHVVAGLTRDWELELGAELAGGVLALVVEAGPERVLKVGAPRDRTADEIEALRRWDGGPAPELLRADAARHALLVERIRPGTRAIHADAGAVAELLGRLHVEPWPALRPLDEVARRRVRRALEERRTAAERAERALATIDALTADAPAPVLLHGDLDERNLLVCDRRGLAAIDPLPCAGDAAFDAASWAHANGTARPTRRQRALAAAAGLDPVRVGAWGEVVAVHG